MILRSKTAPVKSALTYTPEHNQDIRREASAWSRNASKLALWFSDHLVNRTDIHGQYADDGKAYVAKGGLTHALLERHCRAKNRRDIISLHTTLAEEIEVAGGEINVRCTSKWCTNDIDHHSDGTAPARNFDAAIAWHLRLEELGFTPLLVDTNGAGGFRNFVIFNRPIPTELAYHFIRWAQRDWKDFGFPSEPEAFPKQTAIGILKDPDDANGKCGNAVRAFGRHHTRDHHTRFYLPTDEIWLAGNDAIEYVLDHKGDDPCLIPAEVHEMAEQGRANRNRASAPVGTAGLDDLALAADALRFLAHMADQYDEWVKVGMSLHSLGSAGLALWDSWSRQSQNGKFEEGACSKKWGTFSPTGGLGLGSLFHWAKQSGWVRPSVGRPPLVHARKPAEPQSNGNGQSPRVGRPQKERPAIYEELVNFTEKGWARSTILNVEIWLKHKGYEIRRNDFSGVVTVNDEPAGDSTHTEITSLMLADLPETPWNPQHVLSAMLNLANRNRFSPAKDWLNSLSWDYVERIKNLFLCGFGSSGTEYEEKAGRIFMLQAACRILSPGCKADYVPVLTGDQGTRKSTGLMALSPRPEWFSDSLPRDLHDHKISGELLQGRLIIELCELASLNRSSIEATKSFVTRQEDRYREPWGRVVRDHPRMCVFAGTTNEDEFLQDTTNRRFLPIGTTAAPSGLIWIQANRDQLWAEATHTVRGWISAGTMEIEMGKLGAEIETLAKVPQEDARVRDPWEDVFSKRFSKGDKVTIDECFEILAGDPRTPVRPIDRQRGSQMRIAKALKSVGFQRKRRAEPPRDWYYEKSR